MASIFASLAGPPPEIPAGQAAELLGAHYGLVGELSPLASERDLNFLVTLTSGDACVLKFANRVEPVGVTEFQNAALRYLAVQRPDLPVPRVIDTAGGEHLVRITAADGEDYTMRVLSWLDGIPLQEIQGTGELARQTGTRLAELGLALRDFEHAAADYPLLWDIRNAAALAELLPHVSDRNLRSLCAARIEEFEAHTRPRLAPLRRQVIHNDFNPSNMLVAANERRRLAGIIDFGDMVHSQLVNDVAVAAAYFCTPDGDPFRDVIDLVAAYATLVPLTEVETDVLPELILTRHLTTVMITHWRAAMYPGNRAYILRNEARARSMLERVAALPLDPVRERLRTAVRIAPAAAAQS